MCVIDTSMLIDYWVRANGSVMSKLLDGLKPHENISHIFYVFIQVSER